MADGVPLIALGSEPEKMSVQTGSSGGNAGGTASGNSPKKVTIQVRSKLMDSKNPVSLSHFNQFTTQFRFIDGAIIVNILEKSYSYKLPNVANVKYLSFADFTGSKNIFYFNCPDDCGDSATTEKRTFWQRAWDKIKSWFKRLF